LNVKQCNASANAWNKLIVF